MDELARRVTQRVMEQLQQRALLLGEAPQQSLPYQYVCEPPYSAVVIGSMTAHQLLFPPEEILQALLEHKPVLLCRQALPDVSRAPKLLQRRLQEAEQQLIQWGVQSVSATKTAELITASQARSLVAAGIAPPPDSRMTPLARDILEGKEL